MPQKRVWDRLSEQLTGAHGPLKRAVTLAGRIVVAGGRVSFGIVHCRKTPVAGSGVALRYKRIVGKVGSRRETLVG